MIEFLSLFVGLVVGVHEVEVSVSGPVARVEIRLDGAAVAEIQAPPWASEVDFGRELAPAELEAVAFDEAGRELGRARRWINLPGRPADAEIVAVRDAAGSVTGARLTWTSPEFDRPRKIVVELDGRRVDVDDDNRIDLSEIPERAVHVLTAELRFSPDVVIRRELVFGPGFEGTADSGLTAVAVTLEELDELPEPDAMEGWFVSDGAPLRVAAVERPDARVIVVRDPTTVGRLAEMRPELERRRKKAARSSRRRRALDDLSDDTAVYALSPEPVMPERGTRAALLFPFTNRPTPGPEGVVAAAVGSSQGTRLAGPLMLCDAVAVAGIRAAERNDRRAVILLLGAAREDGSRFTADVARRYLSALRVPLVVWDLSGPAGEPPPGWGDARPVDTVDDLVRATRRVRYLLEEQRIVWIGGRHLPQRIVLSPEARGIRLAE